MKHSPTRVPLPGSTRKPMPNARRAGSAAEARFEVTVRVRSNPDAPACPSPDDLGRRLPRSREYLTRDEFAHRYGAKTEDLRRVEAFAHDHGLDVVAASAARRTVILAGTTSAFEKTFDVKLGRYVRGGRSYRGRVGAVTIPKDLASIIEGVFGLDD